MSEDIIFESKVYAEGSKAVLPFKIVVGESFSGGFRNVVVKRIVYTVVGGKKFEEVTVLCGSVWKEEQ